MALASLHQEVISAVMERLLGWKFVKSTRKFVQLHGTCKWYVHLSFANYGNNFNVAMDVAVEHLMKKQRICILGAELGNIRGTGWHTWNVESKSSALAAAEGMHALFHEVGMPFLNRFTELAEVLKTLRTDEHTTRLIFPFERNPALEADRIASLMEKIDDDKFHVLFLSKAMNVRSGSIAEVRTSSPAPTEISFPPTGAVD